MQRWLVLFMMLAGIDAAWAGSGAGGAHSTGSTVLDWGLHRAWWVERDCDHPERPAVLVEIPWTEGLPKPVQEDGRARTGGEAPAKPEVRAGMRVAVVRREGLAGIRLYGTALRTGRTGERIAVRAGLGSRTLYGIVRGPGLVELDPEGAR